MTARQLRNYVIFPAIAVIVATVLVVAGLLIGKSGNADAGDRPSSSAPIVNRPTFDVRYEVDGGTGSGARADYIVFSTDGRGHSASLTKTPLTWVSSTIPIDPASWTLPLQVTVGGQYVGCRIFINGAIADAEYDPVGHGPVTCRWTGRYESD